jgi:putative hydrolase of the HAD superfamily/pyrimidine and pyridine-specific 5'-nucleotidase
LKGLQEEKLLDEEHLDEFLKYAHDVELVAHIKPDARLRAMLLKIKTPKWVFTASVEHHARRCLELLGIDDLFEGIIDVRAVGFETKHSPVAYRAAMRIAGVSDPSRCLFLDDSTSNMRTAREVGWVNILVGTHARDCGTAIVCEHADHVISTVHEFEALMPEHFYNSEDEVENAVPVENV